MTVVVKGALWVFLACLLSAPSHANPTLLNHAQAAFQAVSAMYMKALSHGSPKYQADLDRFKQEASASLQAFQEQDPVNGNEWARRWNGFVANLTVEYSPEFDWDVSAYTRRDARGYISDLYAYISNNADIQEGQDQALLAQVEVQAITARFFDVSSSYNGTISLSPQDAEKLEPKAASERFKARLDNLAQSPQGSQWAKKIASAKGKWEFVEDSVVNYSDENAFFLVYATKKKIAKVLQSTSVSLASNLWMPAAISMTWRPYKQRACTFANEAGCCNL